MRARAWWDLPGQGPTEAVYIDFEADRMKENLVNIDVDTGDEMPDNYPDRGKPPFGIVIRDSLGFVMKEIKVSPGDDAEVEVGGYIVDVQVVPVPE